jgi:hypothetical protein
VKTTEPSAYTRIQVSTSAVFASTESSVDIAPGVDRAFLFVPDDNTLRYIRALHYGGTGFTTSAASPIVSAYPTALLEQAQSDAFASGFAFLSYESDGTLKLNVDSGDDTDTDRFYYEVARNSSTYPTVDVATSPYIAVASMPYFATITIGASSLIGADEVKLHGYFWNAVTGLGEEVRDSKSMRAVKPPTAKWSSVSQGSGTCSGTLTVTDPDLTCTAFEWASKVNGASSFTSYSSTFDSSTGTVGSSTTLVRTKSITLGTKHGSVLQDRITYSIGGVSQDFTVEFPFDPDNVSNIRSGSISFDASGNAIITAGGDEDTANIYVTVTTDGSTPSDPTSGTNDGTISGFSGSVTTAITAADGDTVKAKIRGYNSAPSAGTVFGPISTVYNAAGGGTPSYDIVNAYITAAVDTAPSPDRARPEITYDVIMPGGYTIELDYEMTDSQSVQSSQSITTGETTATRTTYTGYGSVQRLPYYYDKPTYTDWVTVNLRVTIKNGGGTIVKIGRSNAITYNYVLAV